MERLNIQQSWFQTMWLSFTVFECNFSANQAYRLILLRKILIDNFQLRIYFQILLNNLKLPEFNKLKYEINVRADKYITCLKIKSIEIQPCSTKF